MNNKQGNLLTLKSVSINQSNPLKTSEVSPTIRPAWRTKAHPTEETRAQRTMYMGKVDIIRYIEIISRP